MTTTYIDLDALDAYSRCLTTEHPYYGLTTNAYTGVCLSARTSA
jgi:hypothetical protein